MINIDNYLRLNLTDMVLILISTLLICVFAKHFFWDKVLGYFDRREKLIATELATAKKSQEEGDAYKEQYASQLKGIKDEARQLIEAAQLTAKAEKVNIVNKAKEEANQTVAKAHRDIEREKFLVQSEIKKEITEVAFLAASKIVGKELKEAEHKKYVDDFIEHAGEDSWEA